MEAKDRSHGLPFEGKSLEFQVLGGRFVEICQNNELDEEGMKIVDDIYREWLKLLGNFDRKIKVVFKKTGEYPKREAVLSSLSQISSEYLEEAPGSPVGKFAARASDN